MNQNPTLENGALQSVRDSSIPSILPAGADHSAEAVSIAFREEQQELILREAANLEGELSSLNLRLCRMRPDMDACGEALC